jgi:hypothetical protein
VAFCLLATLLSSGFIVGILFPEVLLSAEPPSLDNVDDKCASAVLIEVIRRNAIACPMIWRTLIKECFPLDVLLCDSLRKLRVS